MITKGDTIFLVCLMLSVLIIILTAIFYPTVSDFDNYTPMIIFSSGIILGIGTAIGFSQKRIKIEK